MKDVSMHTKYKYFQFKFLFVVRKTGTIKTKNNLLCFIKMRVSSVEQSSKERKIGNMSSKRPNTFHSLASFRFHSTKHINSEACKIKQEKITLYITDLVVCIENLLRSIWVPIDSCYFRSVFMFHTKINRNFTLKNNDAFLVYFDVFST